MSFSLSSSLSKALTPPEPTKASITCEECSSLSIGALSYNPTSCRVDRNVVWSAGMENLSPWGSISYNNGQPDTLSFQLLLDQTEYRPSTLLGKAALAASPVGNDAVSKKIAALAGWMNDESVMAEVEALYALTLPITAVDGNAGGTMRPPVVIFSWGDLTFRGVVKSLNIDFVVFDEDGLPRRATVTVSMEGRLILDGKNTDLFDPDYEPKHSASRGRSLALTSDSRLSALAK